MLQKLMLLNNKNSLNGNSDDVSMLSLEKQNVETFEGTYLHYFMYH